MKTNIGLKDHYNEIYKKTHTSITSHLMKLKGLWPFYNSWEMSAVKGFWK